MCNAPVIHMLHTCNTHEYPTHVLHVYDLCITHASVTHVIYMNFFICKTPKTQTYIPNVAQLAMYKLS